MSKGIISGIVTILLTNARHRRYEREQKNWDVQTTSASLTTKIRGKNI